MYFAKFEVKVGSVGFRTFVYPPDITIELATLSAMENFHQVAGLFGIVEAVDIVDAGGGLVAHLMTPKDKA